MTEIAFAAANLIFRLLVMVAIIALIAFFVWAAVRAASEARRDRQADWRGGGQSRWSSQPRAEEPVIEVTPEKPNSELADMIQENNRLMREILEELRRRPQEPPPPASSGHLD